MQDNKTAGQLALEAQASDTGQVNVIDKQREMTDDYMKNLFEAVDRGYVQFPGDFFIHVETKREQLLQNIIRNYFIVRASCPTPNYDQTIFRYNRELGQIEYFWTIPDREACHYIKNNKHLIVNDEKELLKFVLAFDDGSLFKLSKKLNGEKEDSPLLEKGN